MNIDLTGKTAVVCGSTQGIGYAAAKELALLGADIVLIARDEEKLKRAQESLSRNNSQQHSTLVADFGHSHRLSEVIAQWAEKSIAHILVNNTGGPAPGKAIDAETEDFRLAFNAHLINNHVLVQALVPGMKSAGYGRIINIISTSVKQPLPNLGVSNTIRAAVANWAKTLANELGEFNITVNNVLPGATSTGRLDAIIKNKAGKTSASYEEIRCEMENEIPLKRLGLPEEIAAVIAFLATPAAAYINGINLPVDGGRTGSL
ncbi:MAG: SDR family oxidoreductase [Crocinitomicaceae bacterium]|nr:SDR family oxidoreductase [Crocinitomicaceae bacterium]